MTDYVEGRHQRVKKEQTKGESQTRRGDSSFKGLSYSAHHRLKGWGAGAGFTQVTGAKQQFNYVSEDVGRKTCAQ